VKKASSPRSAGAGTLYLVHALTHASRSRLDDALRHLDLSSLQYTVLSVLAQNADLSSSRLSRRFYVTPQTMGELILLLEKKGLIERRANPANKKTLLLSLTRFGKVVCAKGDVQVKRLERDHLRRPLRRRAGRHAIGAFGRDRHLADGRSWSS